MVVCHQTSIIRVCSPNDEGGAGGLMMNVPEGGGDGGDTIDGPIGDTGPDNVAIEIRKSQTKY